MLTRRVFSLRPGNIPFDLRQLRDAKQRKRIDLLPLLSGYGVSKTERTRRGQEQKSATAEEDDLPALFI
jgi:hypothetical protein